MTNLDKKAAIALLKEQANQAGVSRKLRKEAVRVLAGAIDQKRVPTPEELASLSQGVRQLVEDFFSTSEPPEANNSEEVLGTDEMVHSITFMNSDPEAKAANWRQFLSHMPAMIETPRPSHEELMELHSLLCEGLATQNPKEIAFFEAITGIHLCTNDSIHAQGSLQRISSTQKRQELSFMHEAIEHTELRFQPEFDYDFTHNIRQIGTRTFPDGTIEKVFGSHNLCYPDLGGNFQGLTTRLDDVFKTLCEKYDEGFANAATNEEKLLEQLNFHILGFLLHPWWDGNGRTFNASTILGLNRMGFKFNDYPTITAYDPMQSGTKDVFFLGPAIESFIRHFLTQKRLLIPEQQFEIFDYAPQIKFDYMQRLYREMNQLIEQGLMNTEWEGYLLHCYHQTRLWLHQKELWDYSDQPTK